MPKNQYKYIFWRIRHARKVYVERLHYLAGHVTLKSYVAEKYDLGPTQAGIYAKAARLFTPEDLDYFAAHGLEKHVLTLATFLKAA